MNFAARSFASALIWAALAMTAACRGDADRSPPAASSPAAPTPASGTLTFGTTTSTSDSGLIDALVPIFEAETGYRVVTVVGGSGQVIEQASRGDADVILVHSPAAEKAMVARGDGMERALVMHNDFIFVGPPANPAKLMSGASLADTMKAIASNGPPFVSRGDDSGTHVLERNLWKAAGIDPAGQSWYEESGQGQAATLQIANQRRAYAISDRGTYLSQRNNLELEILYERASELINVYHVIVVNPERHANVHARAARAFVAFITRPDTQDLIGDFGVEEFGEPLFLPDADKPEPVP